MLYMVMWSVARRDKLSHGRGKSPMAGNNDITNIMLDALVCMSFVFGRLQLEETGGAAFDGNTKDEQGNEHG